MTPSSYTQEDLNTTLSSNLYYHITGTLNGFFMAPFEIHYAATPIDPKTALFKTTEEYREAYDRILTEARRQQQEISKIDPDAKNWDFSDDTKYFKAKTVDLTKFTPQQIAEYGYGCLDGD